MSSVSRRTSGCQPFEVAYLNQILSLCLCDERLQFGGRKGVDQSRLGNDQKKDLGSSQDRQLVCLFGSKYASEYIQDKRDNRRTTTDIPSS